RIAACNCFCPAGTSIVFIDLPFLRRSRSVRAFLLQLPQSGRPSWVLPAHDSTRADRRGEAPTAPAVGTHRLSVARLRVRLMGQVSFDSFINRDSLPRRQRVQVFLYGGSEFDFVRQSMLRFRLLTGDPFSSFTGSRELHSKRG